MTAIREDHAVPAPRVDVAEETRAEIRRAVAALTAVPTDYRAFARSAQHARNVHNIPAHLLAAAVECGLPTVGPATAEHAARLEM